MYLPTQHKHKFSWSNTSEGLIRSLISRPDWQMIDEWGCRDTKPGLVVRLKNGMTKKQICVPTCMWGLCHAEGTHKKRFAVLEIQTQHLKGRCQIQTPRRNLLRKQTRSYCCYIGCNALISKHRGVWARRYRICDCFIHIRWYSYWSS